jgi:hypothetical protein
MRFLNVILLITGALGLTFGYLEWRLSSSTKQEPQTIRCADLIDKGPGDNGHVIVTDFAVLTDSIVVERGSKNSPTWNDAWVPMVPKDQAKAGNSAQAFRLILYTHKAKNEQQLTALANEDKLQGTIIYDIKSLDAKTEKLLRDSYPGTNFESCLILDHDRQPLSPLVWGGHLAIGALSLVALIGLFLWQRAAKKT